MWLFYDRNINQERIENDLKTETGLNTNTNSLTLLHESYKSIV